MPIGPFKEPPRALKSSTSLSADQLHPSATTKASTTAATPPLSSQQVLMAPWTVQGLLEGHHSCSDHIAPLSGRLQPRTTLLGLFGLFLDHLI
jgi:hypothetical protein